MNTNTGNFMRSWRIQNDQLRETMSCALGWGHAGRKGWSDLKRQHILQGTAPYLLVSSTVRDAGRLWVALKISLLVRDYFLNLC